ncbi:DNA-processing protein DprA [Galbitalea soli]|uniref:DNA-protecting protein DprA n=1 Tax=Galbitalea soli TaxID=1268042 RepID=A0A7C9TRU1_9MICO|nr:DNA-processing protein DprA [Galbitalea soli]NEM91564.1 DNA-protecting protein DprA [Galbitalea soli]NYJ30258.1 DNA processing protein [Galbitalea soli]
MSVFGLTDAEVIAHVRAVSGDQHDARGVRRLFARAAWSGIAEPGDRMAGVVVGSVGADVALEALLAGWSAERWQAELSHSGVGTVTAAEIGSAVDRWAPRLNSAQVLRSLSHAARFAVRLLTPEDPGWPVPVDELSVHAPLALWVRGRLDDFQVVERSVALVGARAATGYGEHVTMESTVGLVERGFAIVSGAAYGIDGAAHRAALASHGTTIAVLAGGVDRFYPSGHDALLTRIVDSGAVISELPCGQPPTRWRFLQRNRIIAALSRATVVLEAGWRSGSLNTAGHASQLGRPLGAVPGPITSAASAGCHRLVRDYGATLVTGAGDMAELAGDTVTERVTERRSAEQTRVLDALAVRSARPVDDIAARSGLAPADVVAVLGVLHLEERVVEHPGGWVRRS